jgi:single-stranded-DNA-specific exonuclease
MSVFSQRTYPDDVVEHLEAHGLDPLFARLYAARGIQNHSELNLEAKQLLPPA